MYDIFEKRFRAQKDVGWIPKTGTLDVWRLRMVASLCWIRVQDVSDPDSRETGGNGKLIVLLESSVKYCHYKRDNSRQLKLSFSSLIFISKPSGSESKYYYQTHLGGDSSVPFVKPQKADLEHCVFGTHIQGM